MSTSEILATLRDVQEPLPPEFSLPWLLMANVLVAMIIAGLLLHRWWRARRAWRTEALAAIHEASQWPPDKARTSLAVTLRRVMLHLEGPEINTLSGEAWLRRLDHRFDTDWFSSGGGRLFGDALYTPCSLTGAEVAALCERLSALVHALPLDPLPDRSLLPQAPSAS